LRDFFLSSAIQPPLIFARFPRLGSFNSLVDRVFFFSAGEFSLLPSGPYPRIYSFSSPLLLGRRALFYSALPLRMPPFFRKPKRLSSVFFHAVLGLFGAVIFFYFCFCSVSLFTPFEILFSPLLSISSPPLFRLFALFLPEDQFSFYFTACFISTSFSRWVLE